MSTGLENKYQWNEQYHHWERVERVQEYKGCKFESMRIHDDSDDPHYSREYRITWPSGKVNYWTINKRGGNIKALKEYIDFKIKYGLDL